MRLASRLKTLVRRRGYRDILDTPQYCMRLIYFGFLYQDWCRW
jgi:hypothetical protein